MKTFTRTERQGVARAFKIAKANLTRSDPAAKADSSV